MSMGKGRPDRPWGSAGCPKGQFPAPEGLPNPGLPPARARANLCPMIHDVDESLRALVKRDALNGSKVEIAFDAPTKDWVARRNAPTIDMYLYDIREDVTRRDTAWYEIRDDKGIVTERRLRPRRFKLSYLVTAWTNRPEDEHRLLSALLSCFVRHEFMPPEVLVGTLQTQELPVLMNIALPVGPDRNIADVWSAMGGELKPSLDLIITAPLDIERSLEVGPPVEEAPFLDVVRMESEEAKERGGKGAAGKGTAGKGVAGTTITRYARTRPTAEADIAALAGDGAGALPGDGAGAKGARAGRARELVAGAESGATGEAGAAGEAAALADETFYASAPGKPGRRIRVRSLPRPRPRR